MPRAFARRPMKVSKKSDWTFSKKCFFFSILHRFYSNFFRFDAKPKPRHNFLLQILSAFPFRGIFVQSITSAFFKTSNSFAGAFIRRYAQLKFIFRRFQNAPIIPALSEVIPADLIMPLAKYALLAGVMQIAIR